MLLFKDAHRGARLLAMGAVATVVLGWGVAQWPYLLPTSLKVETAAAPDPTLISVVVVFLLAAVICLPSLGLLYVLDQKSLLDSDEPEVALSRPAVAGPGDATSRLVGRVVGNVVGRVVGRALKR
ncbi:MAG: cytochrome d ubiquinol oxidase subunit II [Acidimicrobiia bacterium]